MTRGLVWMDQPQVFAVGAVPNVHGSSTLRVPPTGDSFDAKINNFVLRREEFASHVCEEHSRTPSR
jgi:hypothetical protein